MCGIVIVIDNIFLVGFVFKLFEYGVDILV